MGITHYASGYIFSGLGGRRIIVNLSVLDVHFKNTPPQTLSQIGTRAFVYVIWLKASHNLLHKIFLQGMESREIKRGNGFMLSVRVGVLEQIRNRQLAEHKANQM